MLYRKIKKTGDELSILGFGCMRLPQKMGKVDEERAIKQIRYAIDKGVNYLDTAMPYHMGASETALGKALSDGYREKVKVATKLTASYMNKPEDMDKIINVQLDNLKTDRIDYYLLHGVEAKSWKLLKEYGACDFLDRAKSDGRIGNTGFSFHGDKDVFKEIIDFYDWDMCQIQYNFLDEHNQAGTEGMKYAASKGIGVVIMEPLRGGNLAGKIPQEVQAIWDEAKVKRTPAEWALRWIWNHPEVTAVLSGMNIEDHIEENIRIANEAQPGSLSDDELKLVKRVADKYQELVKIECTGCRYCMPCPSGVDIPACFELYNQKHIFNDFKERMTAKVFYMIRLGDTTDSGASSFASECVDCGECEEACPQHLPIPRLLKDVKKEFEGIWMKLMGRMIKRVFDKQREKILLKAQEIESGN